MKPTAALLALVVVTHAGTARAQDVTSRAALIEQSEQERSEALTPAQNGKAEAYVARISDAFLSGQMHWHAFWQNAYSGGGFTLGAGYTRYVSAYNLIDVRASFTPSGYKRLEAQFLAPGLFARRGTLSVLGGWREATQVNFFGLGMATTTDNKTNYSFTQPYLDAALEVFPTRKLLVLRGEAEVSQWNQAAGKSDTTPSVESKYTAAALPGLGAAPIYIHTLGTIGIDSRTSPGYTRRGGFYGVTLHDYTDR